MIDFGLRPSPPDSRDFDYRDRRMGASAGELVVLPTAYQVDTSRPLKAYTQQGPSCVGWSIATAATVHARVDQRRTFSFDGAELYSHIALPEGGAYPRAGLDRWRHFGVNRRTLLGTRPHPISGYARIGLGDTYAARHAIRYQRGVLLAFDVTRRWAQDGGNEFRSAGVQRGPVDSAGAPDDILGGHLTYLSGWSEAGLVCLNSWGPAWGSNGRAVISWDYLARHGLELWTSLDLDD